MSEVLKYKEYTADFEWSDDDQVYHGKINLIGDLVTFESADKAVIEDAFHEALRDYEMTFAEMGIKVDEHGHIIEKGLPSGDSIRAIPISEIEQYFSAQVREWYGIKAYNTILSPGEPGNPLRGKTISVVYMAMIVEGDIESKHLRLFADKINRACKDGLIGFATLAPVCKMNIKIKSKFYSNNEDKWLLIFYPFSTMPEKVISKVRVFRDEGHLGISYDELSGDITTKQNGNITERK